MIEFTLMTLLLILVIPYVVYVSVRLGTHAYHRSKDDYLTSNQGRKKNGEETKEGAA